MVIKKWRRPDWRNPDEYPNMVEANLHRWYWEFLRRREDYQEDFYKNADKAYRLAQEIKDSGFEPYQEKEILKPSHPSFTAQIPSCLSKYSVARCPNPAIDSPPFFSYQAGITMTYGELGGEGEREVDTTCDGSEVLIKFNLEKPISSQLESAKEMLKGWQLYYKYKTTGEEQKLSQVRRHTQRWLSYLRALDARSEGEIYEEIGLVIDADDLSDKALEDRLFDIKSEKLKRIGQALVQSANEVQFNFPF